MAKIAMTLAPMFFALVATAPLAAPPAPRAVVSDAPRDDAFPAMDRQLLVPSHGEGMNALLLAVSGKGPHPAVILIPGGAVGNRATTEALRAAGNERVVAVEMDTGHAFADHRIAPAATRQRRRCEDRRRLTCRGRA